MDKQFQEIYEAQYNSIYGYVYRHILNHEESEDLTQEIFTAAYKHFDSFDESKSSAATWLFVITNNKLKNYYRDKKINSDIDEFSEILSDGNDDLGVQAVFLTQCRDVLAKALKSLPEKSRKIVIMTYFDEMSSKDIALELHMSAGNVRITLMRALQKMQEFLNNENFDGKDLL